MSDSLPIPQDVPAPKSWRTWFVIGVLLVVAAAGVGLYLISLPARVPSRFSLEERRELLRLSQAAIGHLENGLWAQAVEVLEKIDSKIPEDPFAVRNLAVAYASVSGFDDVGQGNVLSPEKAEATARKLVEKQPQDPAAYILAARIAEKLRNEEFASEMSRKATQVAPDNANAWYELQECLLKDRSDEAVQERARALKEVFRSAPSNHRAWLSLLGSLVEQRDPQLVEVLKARESLIPKLAKMVAAERGVNDNLQSYYEKAVQAAEKAVASGDNTDWLKVRAAVTPFVNLQVSLEYTQVALNQLKPGSSALNIALDFMVFGFQGAEFDPQILEPKEEHPAISVQFPQLGTWPDLKAKPLAICVADFDLDQTPDLFVLIPQRLLVYRFPAATQDWKLLYELPVEQGLSGLIVTDLDLDAFDVSNKGGAAPLTPQAAAEIVPGDETQVCQQADGDVILYGMSGVRIWRNQWEPDKSARTLVRIEKTGLDDLRDVTLGVAADIDLDGDLDLVTIANETQIQTWSNREDFQFKEMTSESELPQKLHITKLIPLDFDRDADLDLVVLGPQTESLASAAGYLRNVLQGSYIWEPFDRPELIQVAGDVMDGSILEADGNASWDILISQKNQSQVILTNTLQAGTVKQRSQVGLTKPLGQGHIVLDYDNDGYLDLLTWTGKRPELQRGSKTGEFEVAPIALPEASAEILQCLSADVDLDGDLDVVVRTSEHVLLLQNSGGNQNHWLHVRLRALPVRDKSSPGQAKRVNHQAAGSLVELRAGAHYQAQTAAGDLLHFGLGRRTEADLLRIVWTNGVPQGLLNARGNMEICERQAPKGSCPYLYAWDGSKFEFVTDLLWNAPLGLLFAEGVVAQPRAWEYLKVPGSKMQPKEGKYTIHVTEELWEAGYFDLVELIAVDHPADVDVFSNEKVGPASIAEFKIHTVRDPRPIMAAQDQAGRNVLDTVLQEDGRYTRCFDRTLRQGVTEPHFLELDLGQIEKTGPITLFLTGWMFPTETSISVAVSQNPANLQARPPALWVPDETGEWQEIRPFMGFPGGKPKTIAIDLTGVFKNQDHRVRIATNMEFYWDHAFFTVDETPAEVVMQTLKLQSAHVHYRGTSQHSWPSTTNGPDYYDYNSLIPEPIWPPMRGHFTRYGDVKELLNKVDDQLVIIGGGDEITLTFSLPERELPPGWTRDFLMHNVGWDKDADLHTLQGQTVEPMPFNAMSGYPYPASEGPPDSPEYQEYLRKYQTRNQDFIRFWRQLHRDFEHKVQVQ